MEISKLLATYGPAIILFAYVVYILITNPDGSWRYQRRDHGKIKKWWWQK